MSTAVLMLGFVVFFTLTVVGVGVLVWISARDGLGLDLLSHALGRRLGIRRIVGEVRLPPEAGRLHARLHALEGVRGETLDESGWLLQVDLAHADAARLASQEDGEPLRALLPPDEDDFG